MAKYGTLVGIKSSAFQNKSNDYMVLFNVGFAAGDLAGASNTNIFVVKDSNGNQLDVYIASTPAGEFNLNHTPVIPPGGKLTSDLTNGINAQYVAVPFEELVNWI